MKLSCISCSSSLNKVFVKAIYCRTIIFQSLVWSFRYMDVYVVYMISVPITCQKLDKNGLISLGSFNQYCMHFPRFMVYVGKDISCMFLYLWGGEYIAFSFRYSLFPSSDRSIADVRIFIRVNRL